jgi:hypothetical protein
VTFTFLAVACSTKRARPGLGLILLGSCLSATQRGNMHQACLHEITINPRVMLCNGNMAMASVTNDTMCVLISCWLGSDLRCQPRIAGTMCNVRCAIQPPTHMCPQSDKPGCAVTTL